MRHVIALLVENESGALSRIAGLFSARGYNIESLTVAPTEDPTLSRMTIVTTGSDEVIEQITKQLNKLIDTVHHRRHRHHLRDRTHRQSGQARCVSQCHRPVAHPGAGA